MLLREARESPGEAATLLVAALRGDPDSAEGIAGWVMLGEAVLRLLRSPAS